MRKKDGTKILEEMAAAFQAGSITGFALAATTRNGAKGEVVCKTQKEGHKIRKVLQDILEELPEAKEAPEWTDGYGNRW